MTKVFYRGDWAPTAKRWAVQYRSHFWYFATQAAAQAFADKQKD